MAKNAFLDRMAAKRSGAPESSVVKFFLADQEFTLDGDVVKSSLVRKALKAEAKRMDRKYGGYQHPETGERPEVHLVITDPRKGEVSVRLVTDSAPLRAYLKEKGIVIGEIADGGEVAKGQAVE